jgi:hypothetical protein
MIQTRHTGKTHDAWPRSSTTGYHQQGRYLKALDHAIEETIPRKISMDMTWIIPFGIICHVYQKKPKRNKGFYGKSDKKKNAKKGVLVGYEDHLEPVRVYVYHPQDNSHQWVDEDLITFAVQLRYNPKRRRKNTLTTCRIDAHQS